MRDAFLLERLSPHIVSLSPTTEAWETVGVADREAQVHVVGATPQALETGRLGLERGRFLASEDGRQRAAVCVLGADVARELFGLADPIGQTIQGVGQWLHVVGVLASRQSLTGANAPSRRRDINRDVYVPLEALAPAEETRDDWGLGEIAIEVGSDGDVVETAAAVRSALEKAHGGVGDYEVIVPLELLEQRRQARRTFDAVLAGLATLSLLVGGIGIMNIMLATATERTREVGVRRAVGARTKDITLQFLAEAATLSGLGGLAGVVLGTVTSLALHVLASQPIHLSFSTVVGVMVVSVLCGLVFGLYPAVRAASVDPIEALRYE